MQIQTGFESTRSLFTDNLAVTAPPRRREKWSCGVGETLIGDYLAVPLISSAMLRSESYWMENSCSVEPLKCATADYALFSIRSRSGERLATLRLANRNGCWQLDRCLGPAGTEVLEETMEYIDEDGELQTEWYPTELYYVVQEVVRLMNGVDRQH